MEKPKSLTETIQIIVGLLTALSGLAKAAHELYKALTAADLTAFSLIQFAPWLLLLIVGLWISWPLFFRRSRLLRPEALRLDPHDRQHLKGREDDIDRLSRLCREFPQVHLVGESGAGKSALVLAGLCPELTAQNELLPLYLDVWGQDWEAGPRTALAGILWKALSETDRQALKLTVPPSPEKIAPLLGQLRSVLGRTPLLVFDQLDDYQARHRNKFLSGSTWLSAEELIKANRFWRDIEAQLQNGDIRCLFVTRSDAADGLEPFRFLTPKVYHLDRLQSDFVEPLLIELTTADDQTRPIIQAPAHGWNRLKQRLVRDLTQEGTVLPSQMRMAFDGLITLKDALTIRNYERAGGVRGLEAQFVESHVTKAASHSKLAKTQILNLLTHLVEGNKTIPRSTAYLAQTIDLREGHGNVRQIPG